VKKNNIRHGGTLLDLCKRWYWHHGTTIRTKGDRQQIRAVKRGCKNLVF